MTTYFPKDPSNGQKVTIGSKQWEYSSTYNVWDKVGGDGSTGATGSAGATGATGQAVDTFGVVVDGSGSIVTTGSKGFRYIPYDCTVKKIVLVGDTTGTADFVIHRDGNYDTLGGVTIGGVSLNHGMTGVTSPGITFGLTANDMIEFTIQGSPASITRVGLFIEVEKT